MKRLAWPLAAILLFSFVAAPVQAADKPLELKWSELANMIVGHKVHITLTDEVIVGGEVASVRDDSIVLEVRTPAKGYPKGSGTIPRSSVKLIGLERTRGSFGRAIGTTVGVLSGLTLGVVAAVQTNGTAPGVTVFLLVAGGGAVGGYFVGRQLDHHVTRITIVP